MKLIDRDIVIKYIQDESWRARQNGNWGGVEIADNIEDYINLIPVLEERKTEERKTGKWNDDCTCSACGTYSSLNLSKVKYCPECGVKMERR